MKQIIVKLLDWLTYPSTVKGIIGVLGAAGVVVSPEHAEKIVAGVIGLVGVVQIFVDDTKIDKSAK